MKFHIVSKDFKESFGNSRSRKPIEWAEQQGLEYQIEISGEEFGINEDYLILTDEPIEYEEAKDLVQAGFFDLYHMEDENMSEEEKEEFIELLERIEEKKETSYRLTVLYLNNGASYDYIYPLNWEE